MKCLLVKLYVVFVLFAMSSISSAGSMISRGYIGSINLGDAMRVPFGTASGSRIVGDQDFTYDQTTDTLYMKNLNVSESSTLPVGTATINGNQTDDYGSYTYRVLAGSVKANNVELTETSFLYTAANTIADLTGTTTETVMWSTSIDAGLLGPNGMVEVFLSGSCTTSNSNRSVKLLLNGNMLHQSNVASTDMFFSRYLGFTNIGTTSAQAGLGLPFNNNIGANSIANCVYTSSVDTANACTLAISYDPVFATETTHLNTVRVRITP